MAKWTTANIPNQSGRLAVVTGTGGLGFEVALALARAGAEVIIAGRNSLKGEEAVGRIHAAVPHAQVAFASIDLASLTSVSVFAERLRSQRDRLDLLINNAGIMVPPARLETEEGFESQFGINYLGHFALTARLLPLLKRGVDPRVVSVSSVAARAGAIHFEDLNAARTYHPMTAYGQSKLACLMFALELQRRSEAAGWGLKSLAAHPGISRTDLLNNAPGRDSMERRLRNALPFLFQPAAQGALPLLYAATSLRAIGGGYYGPDRLGETRGHPTGARIPPQARDEAVALRLWEASEELVSLSFG